MLYNADPFGHFDIKIGDTARFPLRALGDSDVYPATWDVVAFGGCGKRHLLPVRRRHDGLERWIASHWFMVYANPYLRGGRRHADRRYFTRDARRVVMPRALLQRGYNTVQEG